MARHLKHQGSRKPIAEEEAGFNFPQSGNNWFVPQRILLFILLFFWLTQGLSKQHWVTNWPTLNVSVVAWRLAHCRLTKHLTMTRSYKNFILLAPKTHAPFLWTLNLWSIDFFFKNGCSIPLNIFDYQALVQSWASTKDKIKTANVFKVTFSNSASWLSMMISLATSTLNKIWSIDYLMMA